MAMADLIAKCAYFDYSISIFPYEIIAVYNVYNFRFFQRL